MKIASADEPPSCSMISKLPVKISGAVFLSLTRKVINNETLTSDDDMFLRELTSKALKKAGYEVTLASDGGEAIKKAREEIGSRYH